MPLENKGVMFARVTDLPDHLFQFIKFDPARSRNFIQLLLSMVGTQIEGDELSCCLLLLPARHHNDTKKIDLGKFGCPIPLPPNFPTRFVEDPGSDLNLHFARNIRMLRDSFGRTGDATELVGVLDLTGRIDELLLLRDGVPPSDLALVGEVLCVRPRGALWIYRGEGQTQVLRLRDGTGWAVRDLAKQTEEFLRLYGPTFSRQSASTLIQATWLASQQGRGASLILVDQSHSDYQEACATKAPGVPHRRLALPIPVAFQHPRELLRLATLDGSTLVAAAVEGLEIYDACAYFMTPGGRHASASFVVNTPTWCVGALVTSEDGPVSWYRKGAADPVGGDLVRWI